MKMHTNRHQEAKLLPPDTFRAPKMRLRPGLCPGPRWGSLQRSPDSLAGNGGGAPGKGREEEGRGEERDRGREGWKGKGKGCPPERKSWLRPWHCVKTNNRRGVFTTK